MADVKGFFESAKFNFNDIKIIVGGAILFFMLKQEIHDNKTFDTAEKQIINFRLNDLEKHCGINNMAILPKETELETENK